MQMPTFAGKVERSTAIGGDSFWIAVLFPDKVVSDVKMSIIACKMQRGQAWWALHFSSNGIQSLLLVSLATVDKSPSLQAWKSCNAALEVKAINTYYTFE